MGNSTPDVCIRENQATLAMNRDGMEAMNRDGMDG